MPKGTKDPDHIAIVLDGNRRWARSRGLNPWEGHKAGYRAIRDLAKASRVFGVHTFTIWAFSTENWERPKKEIDEIFGLLRRGLEEFRKEAHKEKVRLVHLGRKDRFPEDIAKQLTKLEEETKDYRENLLNLALDYGGRDEIIRAVKQIVKEGVSAEEINEEIFTSYLDTEGQPYPNPDLFIRTSGEQRTSGLLPWQMIYSEYYFESEHLPDFTPEKLKEAILDYSRRRRRFGGNDSLEHFAFRPELAAKFEIAWWRLAKIPQGTKLVDYTINHLKEQYGLSKALAKDAAILMLEAGREEDRKKWDKAKGKIKKFYKLIKDEVKLAFEPEIVASLEVRLRRDLAKKDTLEGTKEAERTAKELYAEVYRISLFQATKAAHLRVLASVEKNLALAGLGDHHWIRAQDYLEKFYRALKERVA